jgi:rubrerythrin
MKKPLSISAAQAYWDNPAEYYASYVLGIRPIVQMSYFAFGSAVDKGLNAILLGSGDGYTEAITELVRIVNEPTEFLPADYDGELIDEEVKADLLKRCQKLGYKGNSVDDLINALLAKPYGQLSENQKEALTLCCFESLKAKAILMIDAFKAKVFPKLKNISDVQKEYRWTDADGNEFIGIIDFRAEYNGQRILADNKTSGNPFRDYDENCVATSVQFNAYASQTKDSHAAYFVFGKNIKKNRVKTCAVCSYVSEGTHKTCNNEVDGKRCGGDWSHSIKPEVEVLVRFDEMSPEIKKMVQRALTDTAKAIKAGIFPLNIKALRKVYGNKEVLSPYYNYFLTGSMEGLKTRGKK